MAKKTKTKIDVANNICMYALYIIYVYDKYCTRCISSMHVFIDDKILYV